MSLKFEKRMRDDGTGTTGEDHKEPTNNGVKLVNMCTSCRKREGGGLHKKEPGDTTSLKGRGAGKQPKWRIQYNRHGSVKTLGTCFV